MIRAIAIAILITLSSAAESPSEFVNRAISPYVISVISPVQEGDRSDPGHIFQVQTIVSKDAEGNARKVTQKFTPDGADSFVMINGLIKNFDPAGQPELSVLSIGSGLMKNWEGTVPSLELGEGEIYYPFGPTLVLQSSILLRGEKIQEFNLPVMKLTFTDGTQIVAALWMEYGKLYWHEAAQ